MTIVGVIGGGQLARMMIPAALNLGLELRVFSEKKSDPAGLATTQVGDYNNLGELMEFVRDLDVVTFDHEHVPTEILRKVRESGMVVAPSPEALALTHNKITMRRALAEIDVPQPRWCVVENGAGFDSALDAVGGFPCIAKKPTGGYDGKGVRVIESLVEIEDWLSAGSVLLEEKVPFVRELALLSARRLGGQWQPWAPVETRQDNGVCSVVIAPAPAIDGALVSRSEELARAIADHVGVVGVLAVEVFELADGSLLVNELAMRPHNSGHVLTELSVTSQFEQHLRAVVDLPLGSADLLAPVGVMVNLFGAIPGASLSPALEAVPEAKVHDYTKDPRPGRKVGHVVVLGKDAEVALERATLVRELIHTPG